MNPAARDDEAAALELAAPEAPVPEAAGAEDDTPVTMPADQLCIASWQQDNLRPKLLPHWDWRELAAGRVVMVALAAMACW
jgi:hypothetical protein